MQRQPLEAIANTEADEERKRSLPAQLVVCLVIGMSLWSRDSMRDVLKNLVDGLCETWIKVEKYRAVNYPLIRQPVRGTTIAATDH